MIRIRVMYDLVRFFESIRCFPSSLCFSIFHGNTTAQVIRLTRFQKTFILRPSKWVPRYLKYQIVRNVARNVLRQRLQRSLFVTVTIPMRRSTGSAARRLQMLSVNHLLVNSSHSLFSHSSLHLHLPSV